MLGFSTLFKGIRVAGLIVTASAVSFFAFDKLSSDNHGNQEFIQECVKKTIIPQIISDLRVNRGQLRSAVMINFQGDSKSQFSDLLREQISDQGVFDLHPKQITERVQRKLDLPQTKQYDQDELLKLGKSANVDSVIYGNVMQLEYLPVQEVVMYRISVELLDVKTSSYAYQTIIDSNDIETSVSDSIKGENKQSKGLSPFKRFIIWIVLTASLPLTGFGVLRRICSKKSNSYNAVTLAGLLVISLMLAGIIVPGLLSSILTVLLVSLAVLSYSVFLLTLATRLEE